MTYDQAIRAIGRPPTRASSRPDGSREVIWETQVPGGTRHLIMEFGPDQRLKTSRTETKPGR